ncbi:transcription factor ORG2-like [Sesamum indicum]|uniref:Transcription factor ORG2-like n=1 Tax=Sesamum indicum TaxID=4182 RepID=A0A8M8UTC2_SESIN|nr:transcription factor ORG2-like [Sesamum indicum]
MLGISPQLASLGCFMEDSNTLHHDQENPFFISSVLSIDGDDQYLNDSPPSGKLFSNSHHGEGFHHHHHHQMVKKLNHNAVERDRRRKMNTLFSTLRSLLPSDDQSKKLSIAATVSRVLKYIPELRKEVERLDQKKETLMMMRTKICSQVSIDDDDFRTKLARLSAVSATQISGEEIVVQISVPKLDKGNLILSETLMHLEMEGFLVLTASSFETLQGRLFCNLHLQVLYFF